MLGVFLVIYGLFQTKSDDYFNLYKTGFPYTITISFIVWRYKIHNGLWFTNNNYGSKIDITFTSNNFYVV